jgi:hypothetical protein
MDSLTKILIGKSAAYNSAFVEVWQVGKNVTDVEYSEDSDISGTFVRAYLEGVGWSSKYYYA